MAVVVAVVVVVVVIWRRANARVVQNQPILTK